MFGSQNWVFSFFFLSIGFAFLGDTKGEGSLTSWWIVSWGMGFFSFSCENSADEVHSDE